MKHGKDSYYFPHDADASLDERMVLLRAKYKMFAYGCFFLICEHFRRSSDYTLPADHLVLKMMLGIHHEEDEIFKLFLSDCFEVGLFHYCVENKNRFYSESFMKRMTVIDSTHKKLADSGRKGALKKWENEKLRKQLENQTHNSEVNGLPNGVVTTQKQHL